MFEQREKIIQNALMVKRTKEIIVSTYVHDYRTNVRGKYIYAVDGGKEYIRRVYNNEDPNGAKTVDLCLYSGSSVEEIQEKLCWGTYGKTGKGKLEFKFIKNLEPNHLLAILENVANLSQIHRDVIQHWLHIKIKETNLEE